MLKRYFTLYFIIYSTLSFCQLKYNRIDTILVIENNDTLIHGLVGGLNSPQFSEIDLNFDGIMDLFIFEKDGNSIKTFINEGKLGESSYVYTNAYQNVFPTPKNFVLLRDYNCDGKMDFFTGATGGIKVYKNTSIEGLGIQFELMTSLLLSDYNPNILNLYVPSTDIPAIDDLDNDGDLDILTFGVVGSTVEHHENLSMDLYGVCDSLTFRLANTCWGNFSENSVDNGVTLGVACKGNSNYYSHEELRGSRHSGSTILTLDLDADGDKEFVTGDVSFNNLVMLTNGGDNITANMTAQDDKFPLASAPADVAIFPGAYYLDVNNDNIKDLIVAPTAKNVSENTESIWLYTNANQNNNPNFSLETRNFLQSEMIEVGSGANPIFFDANADGLIDIIIGNYGYYNSNSGVFDARLMLLTNVGTATSPVFEITDDDYQNISSLELNGFYPAFGDMDNDGDDDMIIGDGNGELHFYTNTEGNGNTANFSLTTSQYMDIDVGYFATPFIIDYNKDGKKDLLIGERAGTIKYFENNGTASSATFSSTPTIDKVADIDVMKLCCTGYSNVHATFDNNNILTLFVGSEKGVIYQYESTDATLSNYNLIDSILTEGTRVNASLANIDGSIEPEIVSGHFTGGITIYSKTSNLRLIYPTNNATGRNDTLTLDWSSVENVDFYQLQVDTTYNFTSSLLTDSIIPFINNNGDGTDTEFTLKGLLLNTSYYWRTRIISGSDSSAWTNTWKFTTSATGEPILGLEFSEKSEIFIYPNPTSGIFTIITDNYRSELKIFNNQGKLVKKSLLIQRESSIDLSDMPLGIYIGVLINEIGNVEYFKIIKH